MDETTVAEPTNVGADSPPAQDYSQPVGLDDIARYLDAHGTFRDDDSPAEPPAEAEPEAQEPEPVVAAAPEEDASLGGTETPDDGRSPMIPRQRFDQVLSRAKEAETRIGELEQVAAFRPVIDRFTQLGFTPEQMVEQFDAWAQGAQRQPPPVAPAPEPAAETDPFEAWCEEQGLNPYDLEAGQYAALQVGFRAEQRAAAVVAAFEELQAKVDGRFQTLEQQRAAEQAQLEAARQAAEAEQITAQWTADLEQVKSQFPAFQDEGLQQDLIRAWAADPANQSLAQHAAAITQRWETQFRNQLSREAVAKSTAARERPTLAGGNAPSPAKQVSYADLSPLDMTRQVEARLRDAQRAGQG